MSTELSDNGATPEPSVGAPPAIQYLKLDDLGVMAHLLTDRNVIAVYNREGTELFSFGSDACPFQEQAVRFLVSIYKVGYGRGLAVGKEVMKQRYRDLQQQTEL